MNPPQDQNAESRNVEAACFYNPCITWQPSIPCSQAPLPSLICAMDASAAAFDGVLLIAEVEFSRVRLVVLSDSSVTELLVLVDVIP